MSNLSFMEGDTFSEFDLTNETLEEEWHYHRNILLDVLTISAEIFKFISCLGAAGASVFLLCVFYKFQRLRTKTNIFILHYAIASCIDMLLLPICLLIYQASSGLTIMACVVYNGSTATVLMIMIFATAVNIYWFLQTFKAEWLQNCQRFQLLFTVALYVLCLIKFIICAIECFFVIYRFTNYILTAVYILMLIITVAINVITRKNGLNEFQRKTEYQSLVSTYIIGSYFPLFFLSELFSFVFFYDMPRGLDYFLIILYGLAEILAYTTPIVVVYLLGQKNKYFKAAYNKVFKRSIRSYDDDFDDVSEQCHEEQDSNQTTPSNGPINNPVYQVVV